jgi:hypothetical protein
MTISSRTIPSRRPSRLAYPIVAAALAVVALTFVAPAFLAPAPARAGDFPNDVQRTFTTDIPHFFQDDIPCAFGGQPTSGTKSSCHSANHAAKPVAHKPRAVAHQPRESEASRPIDAPDPSPSTGP